MISFEFKIQPVIKAFERVTKYYTDGLLALEESNDTLSAHVTDRLMNEMYIYFDSMARSDPYRYKHMYEWDESGISTARLYRFTNHMSGKVAHLDFEYIDSTKPVPNSKQIFRHKAQALEEGWTFRISPVHSDVLVFEDEGEEVFVRGTVVTTPGKNVQGNFTQMFDDFMTHVAPATINRVLIEFNKFPNFKQGSLSYSNGRIAMFKDVNNVNATGN